MISYQVLCALPPEAFLKADLFYTDWDARRPESGEAYLDEYRRRYEEGLKQGRESVCVYIATNGTWGAATKTGGSVTSYEGIGYHRMTQAFWKGVLDSRVQIIIYRYGSDDQVHGYEIQPGPVREIPRNF